MIQVLHEICLRFPLRIGRISRREAEWALETLALSLVHGCQCRGVSDDLVERLSDVCSPEEVRRERDTHRTCACCFFLLSLLFCIFLRVSLCFFFVPGYSPWGVGEEVVCEIEIGPSVAQRRRTVAASVEYDQQWPFSARMPRCCGCACVGIDCVGCVDCVDFIQLRKKGRAAQKKRKSAGEGGAEGSVGTADKRHGTQCEKHMRKRWRHLRKRWIDALTC